VKIGFRRDPRQVLLVWPEPPPGIDRIKLPPHLR
jgi:hypothetical protein